MATAGGDYFGLNGDSFTAVPSNVSTIVDLLEDKGISWGFYQEDMPYTGYQRSLLGEPEDRCERLCPKTQPRNPLQLRHREPSPSREDQKHHSVLRRLEEQPVATVDVHHTKHDLRRPRHVSNHCRCLAQGLSCSSSCRQELHAEHPGPHHLRRK